MVEGGAIIFSESQNFGDAITNLSSVLADSSLDVFADGELQAESLDLRFGNKVIIKRNN